MSGGYSWSDCGTRCGCEYLCPTGETKAEDDFEGRNESEPSEASLLNSWGL